MLVSCEPAITCDCAWAPLIAPAGLCALLLPGVDRGVYNTDKVLEKARGGD